MSGENHKKPWEYPWTTEEIIENASNWSLASDVALLKTLESFSDVSNFVCFENICKMYVLLLEFT